MVSNRPAITQQRKSTDTQQIRTAKRLGLLSVGSITCHALSRSSRDEYIIESDFKIILTSAGLSPDGLEPTFLHYPVSQISKPSHMATTSIPFSVIKKNVLSPILKHADLRDLTDLEMELLNLNRSYCRQLQPIQRLIALATQFFSALFLQTSQNHSCKKC